MVLNLLKYDFFCCQTFYKIVRENIGINTGEISKKKMGQNAHILQLLLSGQWDINLKSGTYGHPTVCLYILSLNFQIL